MDNLHCVCFDESSDKSALWSFYYTIYRYSDAVHYVSVDVPSGYSAMWMIYCTHHRYVHVVASHHADYAAPPMLYWMHELYMDDPHHICVGVHLKCSVRSKDEYTRLILTQFRPKNAHNCISFTILLSQKSLTPTCFRPYASIIGVIKTSNRSTSCSKLLCTILSATHILQEFPAALLHAKDEYI